MNWALYMADYARYMSPIPEGPLDHLSDCNVSYKRSALQAIGDVWHNEFHEPAVHEALQERGESLWFSPYVAVQQQRTVGLGEAVKDRYSFGRLFGGERTTRGQGAGSKAQGGASRGQKTRSASLRRLIYAGGAIFLPLILVGRVGQHVFRRRRHIGVFFYALPALVLLNLAWAWGEFVGYVTGRPGDSLTPKTPSDARLRKSAAT